MVLPVPTCTILASDRVGWRLPDRDRTRGRRPLPNRDTDRSAMRVWKTDESVAAFPPRDPRRARQLPTRVLRQAFPACRATSRSPTDWIPRPPRTKSLRHPHPHHRRYTHRCCCCCCWSDGDSPLTTSVQIAAYPLPFHRGAQQQVNIYAPAKQQQQPRSAPIRCIFAILCSRFLIQASRSRNRLTLWFHVAVFCSIMCFISCRIALCF